MTDTMTRRVAAAWITARGGSWEQFLEERYEGGRMLVRNTNRDTRDRVPKVQVLTLLKTDPKFRKLLRGQFEKWKREIYRRDQGQPVSSLSELQEGQTIRWDEGKNTLEGRVTRADGTRVVVQTDDGDVRHIRPWDVEEFRPRIS